MKGDVLVSKYLHEVSRQAQSLGLENIDTTYAYAMHSVVLVFELDLLNFCFSVVYVA